jgi:hypothetical protein
MVRIYFCGFPALLSASADQYRGLNGVPVATMIVAVGPEHACVECHGDKWPFTPWEEVTLSQETPAIGPNGQRMANRGTFPRGGLLL